MSEITQHPMQGIVKIPDGDVSHWAVPQDEIDWLGPLGAPRELAIKIAEGVLSGVVDADEDASRAIQRDLVLLQRLMHSARRTLHARTTEDQRRWMTVDLGAPSPRHAHLARLGMIDAVGYYAPDDQRGEIVRLLQTMPEDEVLCLVRDAASLPSLLF